MDKSSPNLYIPMGLRWLSGIVAIILIFSSFWLVYSPPVRAIQELDSTGKIIKTTTNQADINIPFVTIFVGGLSLLLFAVNGLLISKVAAGNLSAETINPREKARQFLETPEQNRSEAPVEIKKSAPEPSDIPSNIVTTKDGEFAVYKLDELPSGIIADALLSWPDSISKPDDLSTFEFATRKTGKGNHPWTLKFKGKQAIVVSYGGQAKKSKATVSATAG